MRIAECSLSATVSGWSPANSSGRRNDSPADLAVAEMSIRRLLDFRGARMLFAHGPEIADPWTALDSLLES